MTKSSPSLEPIDTLAGVQPITDRTNVATKHYTYADKVRFEDGFPRKIGGYMSQDFDYGNTVSGVVRSIFSEYINGKFYVVLGSNEKVYTIIGSTLTNITPLQTTTVAAANSLATQYNTLGNNPFASTNGSSFLTVTDPQSSRLRPGDIVYYSGATGFAGLAAGDINGDNIVRSVGVGTYTINVGVNANATTTGGGAAVVRSSGLVNLTKAAHGLLDGDRVKIAGAATMGGINATDINKEFIIRNVATNTFDFMTAGNASSAVTAAGGASTVYSVEIADGPANEANIQGYGAGLYGVGLYGTAIVSPSGRSYPRIWFMDRYANTIVMTPGNQGGVYQWFGSTATAPALVTNAPTAVNYLFVSDNILVTLGAGGVENRIYASDQNDITQWTSSSINQVYDDDIEGAARLISHATVDDYNLIFAEYETYTFRYIGLPAVWEVKKLDDNVGIIAPMARVSVKGTAYWMGQENFYMYRGGVIETIPANSQNESTLRDYIFKNLTVGQKSKIFAWYDKAYNEVWFHIPYGGQNNPSVVAVVNILDRTWTTHTFDRTAAEWPSVKTANPYLANIGTVYKHELGVDADGSPMPFTLTSNKRYYGKDNVNVNAIIPDNNQSGTITFMDQGFLYPQSAVPIYNPGPQTVTETTERIPTTNSARFHQYTWAGSELGQDWQMGVWFEETQKGPTE